MTLEPHQLYTLLYFVIYGSLLITGVVHILLNRHEPRSATLWLMLVVTVPALGLLLYFVFGIDRVSRKTLRKALSNLEIRKGVKQVLEEQPGTPLLEGEEPAGQGSEVPEVTPSTALAGLPTVLTNADAQIPYHERDIADRVLDRLCDRPILTGNKVRWLSQGDRVYQKMLDAIVNARHHIHVETYIFQADRVGRPLIELMAHKANQGVEVRLLIDTIGSTHALWFLEELARTRIQVAEFSPLNPLKRGWQINLRNHRKLLVVDGRVAFTGGMNINEKHLVDHPLLTRVRDYHFQVEGPVVAQLQECFVEDWHYATGESLVDPRYFPPSRVRGGVQARVITSGPDNDYEVMYRVYLAAITGAQERIYIVSPYFVPDAGMVSALQLAAAKGVKITVVVPGHSDHPFVSWASRACYEPLFNFGIQIYERNAPFLHAKVMLIDDAWALIGSANMDNRSFRLNFEANLEVRNPALVQTLLKAIHTELANAIAIDPARFRRRSLLRRLGENACALTSPLL